METGHEGGWLDAWQEEGGEDMPQREAGYAATGIYPASETARVRHAPDVTANISPPMGKPAACV